MAKRECGSLMATGIQETLGQFLEEQAFLVDRGEVPAQSVIRLFTERGLLSSVAWKSTQVPAPIDLVQAGELLATVAYFDLASSFSLWCHLMTMVYLSWAEPASPLRTAYLPELIRAERFGSTALATALGHAQTGRLLPVTAHQRDATTWVLDGSIPWASNLIERFLVVVPVGSGQQTLIVAIPSEVDGLQRDPYPLLLALQATASTSLRFQSAVIPGRWILAEDALTFLQKIEPAFLGLQACFCWGLAARGLAEVDAGLHGVNEVFRPQHEEALVQLEWLAGELRSLLSMARAEVVPRTLRCRALELRLASMRLAVEAVALEAKVKGGQSYRAASPTARRLREAAFLPIQTPTEGQLLWELQQLNSLR